MDEFDMMISKMVEKDGLQKTVARLQGKAAFLTLQFFGGPVAFVSGHTYFNNRCVEIDATGRIKQPLPGL